MSNTVLLVDDHAVVRDGLQFLLDAQDDLHVVGSAADGQSAMTLIETLCPSVVVMDISLPDMNGIEVTRTIRSTYSEIKILILSMHATADYLSMALHAGADGYVLKEAAAKDVVTAIRAVLRGERYFSKKIIDLLVEGFLKHLPESVSANPFATLSPREYEIAKYVIAGYSSREISEKICLSPKTVETYRSRLMDKLGVHDLPSLVRLSLQHGLGLPT